MIELLIGSAAVATIFGLSGLRIIDAWEKGIVLRFGKYNGTINPGLNWVIPLVDTVIKKDLRQRAMDLKPQSVMTKDQVTLTIDGIVLSQIIDPVKALLNVENLKEQLEAKATSELKEIIGKKTMAESLKDREDIANELKAQLEKGGISNWGLKVNSIQINNISLSESLVRAMSKQAEAEREREARVTKAKGEFEAAQKFADAAKLYHNNFEALRLRELQTYQEIGTEHNSLMIVIPSSMADSNGKWVLPLGKDVLDANGKDRKEKQKA